MKAEADLRKQAGKDSPDNATLSFAGASPAVETESAGEVDYSEIELSRSGGTSDFDISTIAVLAGLVIFTLLMLSVLLVAF
jgi:hypothetical protein